MQRAAPYSTLLIQLSCSGAMLVSAASAEPLEAEDPTRWPELRIESDIEWSAERQSPDSESQLTFDEVGMSLEAEAWSAETSWKVLSSPEPSVFLEEANLRLGPVDGLPLFVQLGRMTIPFGEFESNFVEDPIITEVGETFDDAFVLGYESERLEVATGVYRGRRDDESLQVAAKADVRVLDAWSAGLSFTSDLGESEELRELREDFDDARPGSRRQPGLGLLVAFASERFEARAEAIGMLSGTVGGDLHENRLQPGAFDLEFAYRTAPDWILALRGEQSWDMPAAALRRGDLLAIRRFHSTYGGLSVRALRRCLHAPCRGASSRARILMRVLVVEDYAPVRNSIAKGLRELGVELQTAEDGVEALQMLESSSFDVVILDLMLPKLDGLSLLGEMREGDDPTMVLCLTARDGVDDRVAGLDAGADDYLTKPFAFEELVARVRALYRRKHENHSPRIQVGALEIDLATASANMAGRPLQLSPREYALLEFLGLRRNRVVSRDEIRMALYDLEAEPNSNVIDVYVGYLRRKLAEHGGMRLIETRRGMGYVLREPPA